MDYSWDLKLPWNSCFKTILAHLSPLELCKNCNKKTVTLLMDISSNLTVGHILPEFWQCDDGDIFADNHCSTALSGGWPWRKGRPTSHVPSLPITCVRPYWLEMNKYLPHARKNVLSPTRHVGSTCHCFRENVLTWDGQIFTISWIYFYFAPNYYF